MRKLLSLNGYICIDDSLRDGFSYLAMSEGVDNDTTSVMRV